ncbi:Type-1 restriction enzyme EcoKI specificity protein [Gimesia panareensis]|uniref:Type-1 restriction enzyme EcoKI specificity protein n=1 Tax=Gimesia panareensis TaxID=2527978 RepID=A0A517PZK9_9PLAN|nr:restriction endonuclease subunit S [Gimesia panareensis]QDT24814.1 Type-1 restriction enzyme EcoKI specificity protein [Gimesia panareensis]
MKIRAHGLSQLPNHWKVLPLKFAASHQVSNIDKHAHDNEIPVRLCNYMDVYKNEFIDASKMNLMKATATEHEIERFRLNVGDVIITKDSETWEDIGVPALVIQSGDDVVCGYHLAILRGRPETISGHFLFRCLQSKTIRQQLELSAKGVTRFGLPQDGIGKLQLPIPPLKEQHDVVEFLERETFLLDELIAEKNEMLVILDRKRSAAITQLVTQGLDPKVRRRPSGNESLGDIPEHWNVRRLKYLLEGIQQGWSPQCHNFPAGEGEFGVLKTGCVNGGIFDESQNKLLPVDVEPPLDIEVNRGDILMSRASGSIHLIGSVALVKSMPKARLLLSDKTFRLIPNHEMNPAYLVLAMGSNCLRWQISRCISGAEGLANNITKSDIGNLILPVPPLSEQERIADELSNLETETEAIKFALNETLSLLSDKRSALITAAITGEIPIEEMVA